MSLIGTAVVAIWNDIVPDGRENFIEWHDREHIPERLAIEGFHRGRRLVATSGAPEYFTLYEARDADVLVGDAYLARLNNPTPWTKRSTADFRNTSRGVCRTIWSTGIGEGGHMLTIRFDAAGGAAERLRAYLTESALPALAALPGIVGASLCVADAGASSLETAERKGRNVGVPSWIVLVEGVSTAAMESAAGRLVVEELGAYGALAIDQGRYQLEFSLREPGDRPV